MEGNLVLVKLLNFSSCSQQPTQSKVIYLMRTWTIFNNIISAVSRVSSEKEISYRENFGFFCGIFSFSTILLHFGISFVREKIMSIMLFKGNPWNHKMITFQRVISLISHFWLKKIVWGELCIGRVYLQMEGYFTSASSDP